VSAVWVEFPDSRLMNLSSELTAPRWRMSWMVATTTWIVMARAV